jgi:hypothetical protein
MQLTGSKHMEGLGYDYAGTNLTAYYQQEVRNKTGLYVSEAAVPGAGIKDIYRLACHAHSISEGKQRADIIEKAKEELKLRESQSPFPLPTYIEEAKQLQKSQWPQAKTLLEKMATSLSCILEIEAGMRQQAKQMAGKHRTMSQMVGFEPFPSSIEEQCRRGFPVCPNFSDALTAVERLLEAGQ